MSAPQIPNLNTLRRGGGRFRLRGRGGYANTSHVESAAAKDKVVQGTDTDASVSRLSAVELGYLTDPFASLLTTDEHRTRRYPLINRGTYVRTTAIDTLVARFVSSTTNGNCKKQIISLGAGSDTRVFRLLSENPSLRIVYHELDFPAITARKIRAIQSSSVLLKVLRISGPDDVTISGDGDSLHSPYLHVHPVDLRSLSPASPVSSLGGVDTSLPTLLISECCLVYLSPIDAFNVLSYFTNTLFSPSIISAENSDKPAPLALVLYEPIRPSDPFGKTMVSNLAARGIHLQTLHRYASLDAQRERLREHGFVTGQGVADINFIWEQWINEEEKERVAGLEMLDEVEEWRLLAAHYCVAWGWREEPGEKQLGGNLVFEGWKTFKGQ